MNYLPGSVKKIEEIIIENPSLKGYAKLYNHKRFNKVGFVIFSQPQEEVNENITIYGLLLVDRVSVKSNIINKTEKNELVQDFIAYNRLEDSFVYYSGGRIVDGSRQSSMGNFCKRFGINSKGEYVYYGCKSDGTTSNHRYRNELSLELPDEECIRDKINNAMKRVRDEIMAESIMTS